MARGFQPEPTGSRGPGEVEGSPAEWLAGGHIEDGGDRGAHQVHLAGGRRWGAEVRRRQADRGAQVRLGLASDHTDLHRRVARSDLRVLIQGETGTGKELVARELHRQSGRRGPFLAVNCAALPRDLIESELFGHRKGAFSGAIQDHPGLFRSARQGTLLLDEIGELPLEVQAKLLRVLEEQQVRPVGAAQAEAVEVRVVAASNRELKQAAVDGSFRADLYNRAKCQEKQGNLQDAWQNYQAFLAAQPTTPKRAELEQTLRRLEQTLSRTLGRLEVQSVEPFTCSARY